MTTPQSPAPGTVLDALLSAIQKAGDFNRDEMVSPAAILWPDEKREWERLVPRIREAVPHFLVYGPYDKTARTGPAIWLRCVLAGQIPETTWQQDCVPIIYLPGVSRATLRATEECPAELKPLAELQYRGVFWSQVNGKDWTISAFVQTNHGGLQLKIAKDQATAAAMRRAVEKLLDVPLSDLRAKSLSGELNSNYFHLLISDDPVDDLLAWLSDPEGTRRGWDNDRWEAMCSDCIKNYGFDPVRDGPITAAENLGLQLTAPWRTAWRRFVAAPSRYSGIVEQLRRAKPSGTGSSFQFPEEAWPQDNEAAEAELCQALLELPAMTDAEARNAVTALESGHQHRRDWVWSRFNRAPLARALEHLATLSLRTQAPLAGGTLSDMVRAFTEIGWEADAAVLDALASVSHPQDREAVHTAVAKVYSPWLRDAAELFQERVAVEPLPGRDLPRLSDIPSGTCLLFVDGLRFDIGQKLKAALEAKGSLVQIQHHFVALPSVTATSKPAVSPVASKIVGTTAGEDFRPCVALDEKDLTTDRFRKLLEEDGYQILASDEVGEPKGRAWTEFGHLDKTGHDEGLGLARRVPELLANLVYRVEALKEAGWREVRIVTDHGWLLVPNGLPKSELPKYLTATRWGRCAVVKPSANVQMACFSWFWAEHVRIASPAGIGCFVANQEYSHGGLSLQECVVPQLIVQGGGLPAPSARIESYKWVGLRCRIKVEGQFEGCQVDLRDKAADSGSSLTGTKPVAADGTAALVVADDAREGGAAILVLLDPTGNVLEKNAVTVGG